MPEQQVLLVADVPEAAQLLEELKGKGFKTVSLGSPDEALAALHAQLGEMEQSLRALQRDQESGFRVQRAMMPESPAALGGLTFTHRLFPSMIMSGDFIDHFALPDGRVVFYMADVAGHGASSAFVTVLLKSLARRLAEKFGGFAGPGEALRWLNAELLEWRLPQHLTLFFGVIDPKKNVLDYCNAGHFPGTMLCHESEARFLETGGKPLGLDAQAEFHSHATALPERYALVVISDGVFEVMPEASLAGKEARLLALAGAYGGDLDALVAQLGVHQAQRIPDDIAALAVTSGR